LIVSDHTHSKKVRITTTKSSFIEEGVSNGQDHLEINPVKKRYTYSKNEEDCSPANVKKTIKTNSSFSNPKNMQGYKLQEIVSPVMRKKAICTKSVWSNDDTVLELGLMVKQVFKFCKNMVKITEDLRKACINEQQFDHYIKAVVGMDSELMKMFLVGWSNIADQENDTEVL
jgi:hypothetical protein